MALDGKVILVTGGASGIGLASATRAAAEGAKVSVTDLAAPDVGAIGGAAISLACDVSDESAVEAAVATTVAEFGRLDGVVNCAGVAGGGPVHIVDLDEWQRVIDVNLTGTFFVTKHAVAQMLNQDPVDGGRGSLVTVASVEGIEGTAGGSAYNASKAGVVMLTKCIAIDYGPSGIRANALCPGFVDTPMMDSIVGMPGMEAFEASMKGEHALRRGSQPAEMAAVAAFLLSPDASFVTGHALVADGGYSAGRDHGVTDLMGLGGG